MFRKLLILFILILIVVLIIAGIWLYNFMKNPFAHLNFGKIKLPTIKMPFKDINIGNLKEKLPTKDSIPDLPVNFNLKF